mmetsp:Transcript_20203/g.22546  ORF Transcript_20203/g.22546 Transcript_20203/m.22546 type:complete len:115 (-) Transcript_20203:355-699(-)
MFSFKDAGGDLFFFGVQIIAYWFIIILIENKFYINKVGRAIRMTAYNQFQGDNVNEINMAELQDPDVLEEEQRVATTTPQDQEIRTYLLNKVYKSGGNIRHAVKDVSFGIKFGE